MLWMWFHLNGPRSCRSVVPLRTSPPPTVGVATYRKVPAPHTYTVLSVLLHVCPSVVQNSSRDQHLTRDQKIAHYGCTIGW
jgi:hypothetical protein